jgi:hypothetical protein
MPLVCVAQAGTNQNLTSSAEGVEVVDAGPAPAARR